MSLGTMEQRTEGMKKQANELIEQAYQRGFKAGREDRQDWEKGQADRLIEQGRNEAWEAARKIYLSVYNGGLPVEEVSQIFDVGYDSSILKDFSASEAIEKLRAYEEQKEQEKQEKEEKRMSDLIKRSAALKPYEGLKDDDLISVRTVRENLEHVQTVDFEDEGKCSTCKHDFGRENCGDCEWDSVKHTNTNWEPRVLEGE